MVEPNITTNTTSMDFFTKILTNPESIAIGQVFGMLDALIFLSAAVGFDNVADKKNLPTVSVVTILGGVAYNAFVLALPESDVFIHASLMLSVIVFSIIWYVVKKSL